MHTNNILIAHPKGFSETKALKAFMEALHIKFEVEKPYNKEFVSKIKQSKKQYERGNFISINKNQINELLGL